MAGNLVTRVVFLTWGLGGGGAERTLVHLLQRDWPPSLEPVLVSLSDRDDFMVPLLGGRVSEYRVAPSVLNIEMMVRVIAETFGATLLEARDLLVRDFVYIPQIMTALREHGRQTPIIVVCALFDTLPAALVSRHLLGGRFPVVSIEQVFPETFFRYEVDLDPVDQDRMPRLLRRCYAVTDRVVAVSRIIRDRLIQEYGVAAEKVRHIPNPVVARDWRTLRNGPPHYRLVAMGRLHPVKRYNLLLRALATLSPRRPQTRLSLLGDGMERPALESLADDLGIRSLVEFTGFQSRPQPWLRQADLFVHTSQTEAQPLVILEAMAAGLPVVSVDWPGLEEIVTDGVQGLVVHGEPEAIAAGIESVLDDPSTYRRMSEAGVVRARQFDLEEVVWPRYLDILSGLTGASLDPSTGAPPIPSVADWWHLAPEPVTLVAPTEFFDGFQSWVGFQGLPAKALHCQAESDPTPPPSGTVLLMDRTWSQVLRRWMANGFDSDMRYSILTDGGGEF